MTPMNIYMVYDKANDAWYKRANGQGCCGHWVEQEEASVWTKKQGPVAAIAAIGRYLKRSQIFLLPEDRAEWKTPEPIIVTLIAHYALPEIVVTRDNDNWTRLTIDGKLTEEGYNIWPEHVLSQVGVPYRSNH